MAREQIYFPELTRDSELFHISGPEFHHLCHVRRFREGAELIAINGKGLAALVYIQAIQEAQATLSVNRILPEIGETPLQVSLGLANLKGGHFEEAVEKVTELGVTGILPLRTRHVIKKKISRERLERIMATAIKQCRRSRLPILAEMQALEQVDPGGYDHVLFCHEDGRPLVECAVEVHTGQAVLILVGPEGGWSKSEIDFARRSGYTFCGLGPRRLRAETAATLAVGFVVSLVP